MIESVIEVDHELTRVKQVKVDQELLAKDLTEDGIKHLERQKKLEIKKLEAHKIELKKYIVGAIP